MEGEMAEAARTLAAHARAPPALRFHPLASTVTELPSCIAVDGSRAVLADNGAVWVAATRAAAVDWPGPRRAARLQVHVALAGQAQAQLDGAYAGSGLEAPRAGSCEAWAEGRMALEELGCALAAIEASAPSAAHRLLLVDGALRGLPPHAQAMADRIVAAAGARKLVVLAVAKRSGLEHEGVPLVPLLRRHAPAGCWATEVQPGTFVAHLHPRAATPFRVDAPDIGAVARLAPLCRDAAYPGYPYPLAAAHNAVAITAAQTADLKASLDAAVRRHGGSAAGLLADFHDVLDRNVPG